MRHLRRKLTLRAHGEQIVLVKRTQERIEHVWMKAFLWALFLPDHPDLDVEVDIGDKYKPDVVALDPRRGRPAFWGEAGAVGPDKIEHLVSQYADVPLVFGKWDRALAPLLETVERAVHTTERTAPIDLLRFPPDSAERFVDDRGRISVSRDALTWIRVENAEAWPS
ncbi:MAG: hypothetical protein V5A20_04120 [Salinibacter sp.]|uniref:hypothetical protein n=1 Tax=Salinibacter sp. TaxID=2065818 RepID=UPI002FC3745E